MQLGPIAGQSNIESEEPDSGGGYQSVCIRYEIQTVIRLTYIHNGNVYKYTLIVYIRYEIQTVI